ncbi:SHOCT domain-containing protein [Kitasatospora sp. NPDC059803]|uniref:SHOCT domain-containing protein n=1 Tax=Kitasatospora sp. NPDC059803 TaxID=3346953 RepID=UPI00365ADFF8
MGPGPRAGRGAGGRPPHTAPAELGAGDQLLGQLERLAALHGSGALTDEEFTRAKARLIG